MNYIPFFISYDVLAIYGDYVVRGWGVGVSWDVFRFWDGVVCVGVISARNRRNSICGVCIMVLKE